MRTKRKVMTVLLVLLLLVSIVPMQAGAKRDVTSMLEEAKQGVALIYAMASRGTEWVGGFGTGFAVGKAGKESDTFVTNWHVATVLGASQSADVKIRVWILQDNWSINQANGEPDPAHAVECNVLRTTTGYPDYAIIKTQGPIKGYKALPLMESGKVKDGTQVYALGYPSTVAAVNPNLYEITTTNGMISQHMQYAPADNTWVLTHTAQIAQGNSGGPLLAENGAVVGINTYGMVYEDDSRYYAIYTDYAMEGLRELGIPFTEYGNGIFDGLLANLNWTVIAIAVAVLMAMGGGVVLLLVIQGNKKQELARQQAEAQRRQQEEAERQRAREEEERRRAKEEERRKAQAPVANLRLNGFTTYPIPASGATIGRDRSCTIVLPANAPGVSARHCMLEIRDGRLILMDMNSSYGTIVHGKRIPAGTPVALKIGSSFSLGSDKYTFTVC